MRKSAIALTLGLWLSVGCKGDGTHASTGSSRGSSNGSGGVEQALSAILATSADVQGTVEVRREGQVRWERVTVGATFREHDWVRTGKGSFARLRIANRGYVDLASETTLLVDKSLALDAGSVVAVADTPGQPFSVRSADGTEAQITPSADAKFRLAPSPTSGGLEIAVTVGTIKVTAAGTERAVNAGEATDVMKHGLGEVVKLLAFPRSVSPGVDARFRFVADMKIPLAWKPVPGAIRYFVEIARDTEFHSLLTSIEVSTLSTLFTPDAKGIYAWRVTARDPNGRLGEAGFGRRIYCEDTDPRDLLVAPANGTRIQFPNKPPAVNFSWQPLGDVTEYKLVVRREDTDEVVATQTATGQRSSLTLEPGSYHWGVYAIQPASEDPIFVAMRVLTIAKQEGPKIRTEVQWGTPKH